MQNVLHIITTINRGGAENHLFELIDGQCKKGFNVSVAYLKGNGYWRKKLEAAGARVYPLKMARYGDLRPAYRLWKLIKTGNPSIVHAHLPPAELYVRIALLGLRADIPLVISKHNIEPFFSGPGAAPLARWVAKRARRIVAVSHAVRQYCEYHQITGAGKIKTIHHGIRTNPFDEVDNDNVSLLRNEWLGTGREWLIGTVARLAPEKKLDTLIEGFAEYHKIASKPSRLVIVGSGPLERSLRDLAKQRGLDNEVLWEGFREDIPEVMCALDVFVLTSEYEGFGLVLLEAMAAKRPVVASRIGAISEIVQDDKTGILVPPLNSQSVAKALLDMEKEHKRRAFGKEGYKRVKKDFSIESMVDKTLTVYTEAMGS